MTAHYTNWTSVTQVAGNWFYSPDFAEALQEVIERGDWVSGNAVAVLLVQQTDSGGSGSVDAFESGAGNAAYLEVIYQDGSGGAMM